MKVAFVDTATDATRALYVDGKFHLAVSREALDDEECIKHLVKNRGYPESMFKPMWIPNQVVGDVSAVPQYALPQYYITETGD